GLEFRRLRLVRPGAIARPAVAVQGRRLRQDRYRLGGGRGEAGLLKRADSYEELCRAFRWEVPARFNIGAACVDRHATGHGRLALIYEATDGSVDRYSFENLRRLSNRCANAL